MTSASNCGDAVSRGYREACWLLSALLLTVACDRQEKSPPPPLQTVVQAIIIPMEAQNPLRDALDAWADGLHDQALAAFLELSRVPLGDLTLTSIDPLALGARTPGEQNDYEPVFFRRWTAATELTDELIRRAHDARAAGGDDVVTATVAALAHVADANDIETGRSSLKVFAASLRKRLDELRAEATTAK
ncbi:MAG: hypothetical protein SGJ11_12315 [Phycisphaerae bacterium]|nr:hypothetical protein [Phycisphaerae bacterium]